MAEQQKKPKVGIVGSGSWATALSKILLNNVDSINWWVREEDVAQNLHIYGRNPLYLSSVGFNRESLNIYTDISKLIAESDHIIFVIPAAFAPVTVYIVVTDGVTTKLDPFELPGFQV